MTSAAQPFLRRFRQLLLTALGASLMVACGGGGGGSTAINTSPGSVPVSTTVPPDGTARTVNTNCPFTQALAGARNDGLRIEQVRWLQTVALDPNQADTRLAGGKAVKLRVDLLANSVRATPVVREVRIYDPASSSCTRYSLSGPNTVPTSVDMETLSSAFVATIPADKIKPGMGMSIVFDEPAGRSTSEADATYRYYLPSVATAQTETVRIIPLTILGTTASINTANLSSVLTRMHPISDVNVISTPALTISTIKLTNLISTGIASLSLMTSVLDEVDNYCAQLNGNQRSARTAPKCIALFPDTIIFRPVGGSGQIVGLAYVGGISMIAQQVLNTDDNTITSPYMSRHWMNYRAVTLAHEYGHLLNLDHGACGGATVLDPRLYSDGRLDGGAGWDAVRDVYFSSTRLDSSNQPQFADVMSYCGKEWASDRGYLAALNYRSASGSVAARVSDAPEQWLKISVNAGVWQARAVSFAPATLKLTTMDALASSEQAPVVLPVYSAVLSDNPELSQGPYFVNLGALQVNQLQIREAGKVIKTWSASTGFTN